MDTPATTAAAWCLAGPADAGVALGLLRAFYAEERLDFDPAAQGKALRALLADPALGAVFLLRSEPSADSPAAMPLGHLVLTWACSLEFGGRFILLDELYLVPAARGRGEGRRAVTFAADWARAQGAKALRLEVSHENTRARALYRQAGLEAQARDLLTLRLA
jgi:GNAT superfamily N-acetyltransferase